MQQQNRKPETNRTRKDTKLSLKVQQNLLIDLVDNPTATPGQIIKARADGLYGDLSRGDSICKAVKSKIYYYKDLKGKDEASFW